jgi:hypothetical protein
MACLRRRRAPEARLPPPPSERRRQRRVCPGEPPATVAVTLDDAALGQSAEPHGDCALVAAGCFRPLDDASLGMVAHSLYQRPLARRRFLYARLETTAPARTRARQWTGIGAVWLCGVRLQPLRDLAAHGIRPAQDRVDSVAQRAKLSPVHRSSPFSRCAIPQIRRDHAARKVCGSRVGDIYG